QPRVSTNPITDGAFHFVTVVGDRTTQMLAIYLDGVLQQQVSIAQVGDISTSVRLVLGHETLDISGNPVKPFVGVLDEVEIFDRTLSASDIQAMFLAGSSGKCKFKVGDTVALDGTGSSDADGDALTYRWSLLAAPTGSAATLNNPTAINPTFIAD